MSRIDGRHLPQGTLRARSFLLVCLLLAACSKDKRGGSDGETDTKADADADGLAVAAPDGTSSGVVGSAGAVAAATTTLDDTDASGATHGVGSDLFGMALTAGDMDGDG